MAGSSPSEIIFISVNQSVTLIGKVWLVLMIFLRGLILLLAGYPLYQDEEERFVCNTIQPGCANVCYDIFSPISLFRFWLVQLVTLSLPYIIFTIYVTHKVSNGLDVAPNSLGPELVRCFTGAYIFQLMLRTLLEAGFGAAHYYMFGFSIPRRFLCQHPPCTTQVDCYISRPTEKTLMLNFMLGVSALSLFLNALDFICAIKRSMRQKSKRKLMECVYEDERDFLGTPDPNFSVGCQTLETEAGPRGSFRKRCSNSTPTSNDHFLTVKRASPFAGDPEKLSSLKMMTTKHACSARQTHIDTHRKKKNKGLNLSNVLLSK
uniref:Gap junction protein n=1 Tax=Hippocampus comes TaxID=109280 RepID=A0A3Q2YEW4_HIPCM